MVVRVSRQTLREKLQSLIEADMVGAGKALSACFSYSREKIQGVVPCMVITSEGTQPDTTEHSPYATVALGVYSFVLYRYVGTGTEDAPEWSEQESENALDTIAKEFRELCDIYEDRTQEVNPEWEFMLVGQSKADSFKDLEGLEFRYEYFPILMQVPFAG